MPLYEGIGLINEKQPVVIEIGYAFTRAGFAGESSPRCIVPSVVKSGGESRRLADYRSANDLYKILVDFLQNIYFRHLLVTPKDRKVVVVESIFAKTEQRQILARVLYLHYEIQNVLWLPDHLAAICVCGTSTGLIVDIGYEECKVIPVCYGITLLNSIQAHVLGSKAYDSNLKSLLKSNCLEGDGEVEDLLTDKMVQDIRMEACFVTTAERAKILTNKPENMEPKLKPFTIGLDGEHFYRFNGIVRELASEIWFQNDDLDGISIPRMILDSISNCPIDVRRTLASSILICGGTSMIPGLKRRIVQDLTNIISQKKVDEKFNEKYEFKIYDQNVKENLVSWLGGSIYGTTEWNTRGISKEFFLKNAILPDWCNSQFVNTTSQVFSASSTPIKSL